jgi:hypothetical protein
MVSGFFHSSDHLTGYIYSSLCVHTSFGSAAGLGLKQILLESVGICKATSEAMTKSSLWRRSDARVATGCEYRFWEEHCWTHLRS